MQQPKERQGIDGEEQVVPMRVISSIDHDEAYFESYARISVHEQLLKDKARTDAYLHAIIRHEEFIRDKVVLDVGCGTGILAILCAQAGAKRVYAVEATHDIAHATSKVVEDNNLSNIITVLQGRIEDVEIKEQVDVIISEWMGYMLLHKNMLESVITARDRWLKPGGLMLPSKATLYMAPVTNTKRYEESINYWNSVYGINMSAFKPLAKQSAFLGPCVETITFENVLARPQVVKCVNCDSVTIPELRSVTESFKFNSTVKAPLHGFAFWFDVEFGPSPMPLSIRYPTSSVDDHPPVDSQTRRDPTLLLSTAPNVLPTHWQQTLIYFFDPKDLKQDQLIEGRVTLSQNQASSRLLDVKIAYDTGGQSHVKYSFLR
ncbi:hypothetical protein GYH30_041881 [Glycine max]|nr:hypothetical protein GYH30_041881 [Glycine max]